MLVSATAVSDTSQIYIPQGAFGINGDTQRQWEGKVGREREQASTVGRGVCHLLEGTSIKTDRLTAGAAVLDRLKVIVKSGYEQPKCLIFRVITASENLRGAGQLPPQIQNQEFGEGHHRAGGA